MGIDNVELYGGIALIVLGVVLFFMSRPPSRKKHVSANNGSVAVGGDNSGPILNTNIGGPPPAQHGTHWLTVAAIVVELLGIAVVIWHAYHLAAK